MKKQIVSIFVMMLLIATVLYVSASDTSINDSALMVQADATPPTVSIIAPQPGIYFLGNKLISFNNVFIIGTFTIETTATDAESGIFNVEFFIDDELIGEDTEPPYSKYCSVKHIGEGTIKVIARDFVENTAEDTLDIIYYKFF